jgi:carbonic anhydrase
MNFKGFIAILTIAAILTLAQSSTKSDYSYPAQGKWPEVCTTGQRQSPINVITSWDVRCTTQLWPLQLSNEYYQPISGEWENKGHTVEFTPDDSVNAIMTTPVGRYKLKQFHMHWGAGQGQGSEHLIDGRASELEIHFVHKNIDVADDTARDANAVLSIRGRLQYTRISGIYSQLDVANIKSYGSSPVFVSGIYLSSLLPYSGDYFYYGGSLTTPNCNEVVQWFLAKEEIGVPADYLANLRTVRDTTGNPINFNFRNTQALHGRHVYEV